MELQAVSDCTTPERKNKFRMDKRVNGQMSWAADISDRVQRLENPRKVWQLVKDDVPRNSQCAVKFPADVAFVGPKTFAVADSEGHKILIYDIHKNVCNELAINDVWPNCIAVTRDKKLVVTDRKSMLVKLYDLNGKCIRSFGRELLERPHGVTANSKGEIFVTDTERNCVTVFNPEGYTIREFGHKGSDISDLHLPFYCAIDWRDNLIVSDNMNYAIKIFDVYGNYLFKIGSGQDWGQRQFQCPYGVCVDLNGNILVADWENHRVYMYGPGGKFIKYILTKGDKCMNPCGLSLGPCGTLVLTECSRDYANVKAYEMYQHVNPGPWWQTRFETSL